MRCVTNPETEIGRVVIDSWMDGSRVDDSDLRSGCELHCRQSWRSTANVARSGWKQMLEQMNNSSPQMIN